MKKHTLHSLLALTIWIFYSSCSSVKKPEFLGIENVRTGQVSLKESAINLDMVYFNPNKYRLKIKRAEGDAWVNGNPLGHFTLDTLIHIPANDSFRIPLRLKMDMRYFVDNMAIAFSGKEVALKVEGMARAGKSVVYGDYPIKYEGKQRLGDLLKK